MSAEQDFEQVIKYCYDPVNNCLDLRNLGAAVAAGTDLDAEQVLKMVFEKLTNQIRAVEA